MAQKLDHLNQERKGIEQEMKRDADEQLKEMFSFALDAESDEAVEQNHMAWGLCLYEEHWHQGVIGILASRIKERFHRPVIIFAPESDDPQAENSTLKGSARSISGFHMRDALDLIAKRHPHLLSKFGGHAMAAGMSIDSKNFAAFSDAFDKVVREQLSDSDLEDILTSDGELEGHELTLDNIHLLEMSGPWGQQFPEPCFDGIFNVVQSKVLKGSHLKLVLSPINSTQLVDAIQFNSEWISRALPEKVQVAYRPNINEFRGRRSIQFLIDGIELIT